MSSGSGGVSNDILSAQVFLLNTLPTSSQFEIGHHIGMICEYMLLGSRQIVSWRSDYFIIEGLRICETLNRIGPVISSKQRYLGFQKG